MLLRIEVRRSRSFVYWGEGGVVAEAMKEVTVEGAAVTVVIIAVLSWGLGEARTWVDGRCKSRRRGRRRRDGRWV